MVYINLWELERFRLGEAVNLLRADLKQEVGWYGPYMITGLQAEIYTPGVDSTMQDATLQLTCRKGVLNLVSPRDVEAIP